MRAAIIRRHGGPEEFEIVDLPTPTPGPGEVLVKVAYAGVNPFDYKVRDGSSGAVKFLTASDWPLVLGKEASGTIAALGEGVSGLTVGEPVYGMTPRPCGCYGEYAVLPADAVCPLEPADDLETFGGTALAGLTAWRAVHDDARLTKDDVVLIHGGGGGVGQIMVQLAAELGAEVWTTASGRHRDKLERWGAHVIDYTAQDFTQVAPTPTVIIDGVYFGTYERSIGMLKAGDRMVVLPSLADLKPAQDAGLDIRVPAISPDRGRLEQLASRVRSGKLEIVVGKVFDLDAVADAHRVVESGHAEGKVVLKVS